MLTAECVILSVCPPYLEIDQLTSSILRRHISSVFRQFSLLFSYAISLRISWVGQRRRDTLWICNRREVVHAIVAILRDASEGVDDTQLIPVDIPGLVR